jgi:uncharacterized damage-inducible protein DinB
MAALMSDILERMRNRHLTLMEKTIDLLRNVLQDVSQQVASTLRDGEGGWTVLEVLGHLREFDEIFYHRAARILNEDTPLLDAYDHDALAVEHAYNTRDLGEVYAQLRQSRARFIEFFRDLPPESWERAGIHPENGYFTLLDALMQVGHHDVNHLEQITRILNYRC